MTGRIARIGTSIPETGEAKGSSDEISRLESDKAHESTDTNAIVRNIVASGGQAHLLRRAQHVKQCRVCLLVVAIALHQNIASTTSSPMKGKRAESCSQSFGAISPVSNQLWS